MNIIQMLNGILLMYVHQFIICTWCLFIIHDIHTHVHIYIQVCTWFFSVQDNECLQRNICSNTEHAYLEKEEHYNIYKNVKYQKSTGHLPITETKH